MVRGIRWIRYGVCTCLGLAVIGLAAITSLSEMSDVPPPLEEPGVSL